MSLSFENRAYASRLGWREIVVSGEGVDLEGDFATTSLSSRLTSYPDDLLSSPLDQRQVSFQAHPVGAASGTPSKPALQPSIALPADRNDAFTRLILLGDHPAGFLFAWPSLSPGGDACPDAGSRENLVNAYLVGSRHIKACALPGPDNHDHHRRGVCSRAGDALRFILPETLFPWLSLLRSAGCRDRRQPVRSWLRAARWKAAGRAR
jgi:hypothetical protein